MQHESARPLLPRRRSQPVAAVRAERREPPLHGDPGELLDGLGLRQLQRDVGQRGQPPGGLRLGLPGRAQLLRPGVQVALDLLGPALVRLAALALGLPVAAVGDVVGDVLHPLQDQQRPAVVAQHRQADQGPEARS